MKFRLTATLVLCLLMASFIHSQNLPNLETIITQKQKPNGNYKKDSLPYFLDDKHGCKPKMSQIEAYLKTMPYVISTGNPKTDALISDYAFSRLIRADFTKTVLGQENTSKIDRYATLDLSDKPSFDFSPFTWSTNAAKPRFQNMLSLNISGKLNSANFFELKNLRELTVKINHVHIINNWTNYKPKEDVKDLKAQLKCDMEARIVDLIGKYETEFEKTCDTTCTPKEKVNDKRTKMVNAFLNDMAAMEIEVADPYWRSKHYFWYAVNVGLKRDQVQYVNKTEIDQNIYEPVSKTIFTPELLAAFNNYNMYASGSSILFTLWSSVKQKHSLSEVYSPENFQPYTSVTTSVMQLKDQETVFVTDFEEIEKKAKVDFGVRAVLMSPNLAEQRNQQVGLAASFSRKGLVHSTSSASLKRTELGLVFPFLKEDGSSKFNLELFHRWDDFSKFPNEDETTWGFRFNIPLSN